MPVIRFAGAIERFSMNPKVSILTFMFRRFSVSDNNALTAAPLLASSTTFCNDDGIDTQSPV